jgi:hypothetical protein
MAHLCIHLEIDHVEHEQELQVEPKPVEDSATSKMSKELP